MTLQYKRLCSLVVGNNAGGDALDLKDFKIEFRVQQGDTQTPNTLVARVFNLSASTANYIRGEFKRVVLQAGYKGNFGALFDGSIKHVRIGRLSATDSYVDIYAADGDLGYNYGVVNQTVAAGASPSERLNPAVRALSDKGVQSGYIPDLGTTTYPRGSVYFGMARDALNSELDPNHQSWSIQNGQLQIVPVNGVIPGKAIVINEKTGMVGVPELTDDGVVVRCLINPNLRVGGMIQLNNDSIQDYQYQLQYTAINLVQYYSRTAKDGIYKILAIDHNGDTRGNEWYSTIICVDPKDVVTLAQALRGRGGV